MNYAFMGDGALSGSLALDDSAPFTITQLPELGGWHAELHSPLNHISGTLGAFTFEGSAYLAISNFVQYGDTHVGQWIVRADITGPTIDGFTPTKLNLFVYPGEAPLSLVPPIPGEINRYNFQYDVIFADGSAAFAALTDLHVTSVVESSTAMLLLVACALVITGRLLKSAWHWLA